MSTVINVAGLCFVGCRLDFEGFLAGIFYTLCHSLAAEGLKVAASLA